MPVNVTRKRVGGACAPRATGFQRLAEVSIESRCPLREPMIEACDAALQKTIDLLEPELVVGVGVWAQKRAKAVLGDSVRIGVMLHPSPASPKANRGWAPQAEADLEALGVKL